MAKLFHMIYVSKATYDFSEQDLLELLSKARQNNKELNIHGMLLYDEGSFFQVLEGEKNAILDLYEHISKDKRHQNIVKLIFETIPEMSFSDWSMGYSSISRREIHKIDGMNDFFVGQTCLADIDSGRAMKLLEAFASGRWRLS